MKTITDILKGVGVVLLLVIGYVGWCFLQTWLDTTTIHTTTKKTNKWLVNVEAFDRNTKKSQYFYSKALFHGDTILSFRLQDSSELTLKDFKRGYLLHDEEVEQHGDDLAITAKNGMFYSIKLVEVQK